MLTKQSRTKCVRIASEVASLSLAMTRPRLPRRALALLAMTFACGVAQAQTYPSKPVRIVIGFPPAGATDVVARTVGDKLGAPLGQAVIVDNRPGAASNIAAELVANAPK